MAGAVAAHRWRALWLYATVPPLLAVLAFVLPAGNDITAAPEALAVGQVVDGDSCLGPRVSTIQSGEYLDLYEPGEHGGDVDAVQGAHLASGRIDRITGDGELHGTCAPGSRLDGRSFDLSITVERREEGDGPLTGVVVVDDGRPEPVQVVPEDRDETNAAAGEPLEGSELVGRLLLAVAIVILACRAVGWAFGRIGQPRVIGEIVAGILLGPSLAGLWLPDVTDYLFPPEIVDVLRVLAQLGLVFFMFLIGLEVNWKLLRGSGHVAVLVSHMSIVVPFVSGAAIALVLYPRVGSGDFTGFALFMGAAMAITAFPVLARILTDTGLQRTRLGALAITCAAVDDVTAWCILAAVVAIVNSSGASDWLFTIGWSAVFVATMLLVVRPLARRLTAAHDAKRSLTPGMTATVAAGVLLAGWATEAIGIHAIFGAFLFGAVMPRSRGLTEDLAGRFEDMTVLVLLPIFFAVVGVSTRIDVLDRAELWVLTGLVIAVATFGKLSGSVLAARASGQDWRTSGALGLLMNTRGLTEIVILTVGRSLGVISPALFTIMVLMALVTTFMATPVLALVYPRQRIELDRAASAAFEHLDRIRDRGPRLLVGVGDAEAAEPLVDLACAVRGPDDGAPTVVVAAVIAVAGRGELRSSLSSLAVEPPPPPPELVRLWERAQDTGVAAEVVTAAGADVPTELARLAAEHDIDAIILAARSGPPKGRLLDGIPGQVPLAAACDVAILVGGPVTGPGPVAVWYEGKLRDFAAIELASGLARGLGVAVRVVMPALVVIPDLTTAVEPVVLADRSAAGALDAVEGAAVVVMAGFSKAGSKHPTLRDDLLAGASSPVLVVRGERAGSADDVQAVHEVVDRAFAD